MIRSSAIPQHTKSAPLPRSALFVCLPKDSPTRHELLSRIVILNGKKEAAKPPPYKPSPHGEGGPRQRRSGAFVSSTNAPLFPLYYHLPFIPCLPYPPLRAPSPRGEGCDMRIPSSKKVVKLPPYNKAPSTSVGMTGGRRVISHSLSHRLVDPSCAFGAPLL